MFSWFRKLKKRLERRRRLQMKNHETRELRRGSNYNEINLSFTVASIRLLNEHQMDHRYTRTRYRVVCDRFSKGNRSVCSCLCPVSPSPTCFMDVPSFFLFFFLPSLVKCAIGKLSFAFLSPMGFCD